MVRLTESILRKFIYYRSRDFIFELEVWYILGSYIIDVVALKVVIICIVHHTVVLLLGDGLEFGDELIVAVE